jgi:hypothetical protein
MSWNPRRSRLPAVAALALLLSAGFGSVLAQEAQSNRGRGGGDHGERHRRPIELKTMGSLYAGGGVIASDSGVFHYDHLYAYYHVPVKARKHPLVMWHGCLSPAWETTPDGREGFQPIFVRRGWSVYVIDQPRNGRAGRGLEGFTVAPAGLAGEPSSWNTFRLGKWVPLDPPTFFPGVQFPQDSVSLAHYFRYGNSTGGPPTGATPSDAAPLTSEAVSALLDEIGPSVLVTHSASGIMGWVTRTKNENVRGIVAYEPTAFVFPNDEPLPPDIPTEDARVAAITAPVMVSPEEFEELTNIPIQIVYGDNIEFDTPSPIFGVELWRVTAQRVQHFADAVNRHGGDVEILYLPKIGVFGNTHFPFFDLNNQEVADLMSRYLHEKLLDRRPKRD